MQVTLINSTVEALELVKNLLVQQGHKIESIQSINHNRQYLITTYKDWRFRFFLKYDTANFHSAKDIFLDFPKEDAETINTELMELIGRYRCIILFANTEQIRKLPYQQLPINWKHTKANKETVYCIPISRLESVWQAGQVIKEILM